MFDRFHSTLDRELGPAPGAQGGPPVRDPWVRDWPLLLGLVVSAALVAASMLIGGSPARPAATASKPAAAVGTGITGEVVDVGEGESGAAEAKPHKNDAASPKQAAKHSSQKAGASDPGTISAPAESSDSAPTASSGSGGKHAAGSDTPAAAAPPKPGRIVNVTGTSAAFTNGPLSYQVAAPTHTPTVGKRWRLTLSAKRSGAALSGTVKVDILHQGSVVGHVTTSRLVGGRFAHDFDWPDRSVGVPLTVKATVVGGGFQQSFLFDVKVARAG
jgi:hypothetical protein